MVIRVPGALWELGDYNPKTNAYDNIRHVFIPTGIRPSHRPLNVLKTSRIIKSIEITEPNIQKKIMEVLKNELEKGTELYTGEQRL